MEKDCINKSTSDSCSDLIENTFINSSESYLKGDTEDFQRNILAHNHNNNSVEISFDDKKKEQELNHDNQDHKLKISTAKFLLILLFFQSFGIFLLVFLQGFAFKNFKLSEYIFYILISGVLTESYFLVRIVVNHLFPIFSKDDKENKPPLQKP